MNSDQIALKKKKKKKKKNQIDSLVGSSEKLSWWVNSKLLLATHNLFPFSIRKIYISGSNVAVWISTIQNFLESS